MADENMDMDSAPADIGDMIPVIKDIPLPKTRSSNKPQIELPYQDDTKYMSLDEYGKLRKISKSKRGKPGFRGGRRGKGNNRRGPYGGTYQNHHGRSSAGSGSRSGSSNSIPDYGDLDDEEGEDWEDNDEDELPESDVDMLRGRSRSRSGQERRSNDGLPAVGTSDLAKLTKQKTTVTFMNLAPKTTESDLEELCRHHAKGDVFNVQIVLDPHQKRVGIVDITSREKADLLIDVLNGMALDGSTMRVCINEQGTSHRRSESVLSRLSYPSDHPRNSQSSRMGPPRAPTGRGNRRDGPPRPFSGIGKKKHQYHRGEDRQGPTFFQRKSKESRKALTHETLDQELDQFLLERKMETL